MESQETDNAWYDRALDKDLNKGEYFNNKFYWILQLVDFFI